MATVLNLKFCELWIFFKSLSIMPEWFSSQDPTLQPYRVICNSEKLYWFWTGTACINYKLIPSQYALNLWYHLSLSVNLYRYASNLCYHLSLNANLNKVPALVCQMARITTFLARSPYVPSTSGANTSQKSVLHW